MTDTSMDTAKAGITRDILFPATTWSLAVLFVGLVKPVLEEVLTVMTDYLRGSTGGLPVENQTEAYY
jgi:hypothetical protein